MLTRSALIIIFLVYQSWSWGQAGIIKVHSKPEDATKSVVTGIRIEKHGCGLWDVYVQGYVTNKNGYARVPGALIRGTLLNSRDIDFVYYFDHYSYIYPGFSYYIHYPNYTNESRAISDAFGFYQLRFDVCIDDWGDPTATVTATPTLAPTATPTRTPTHSGIPPASHPQLDVDQDGEIGPGDLLLLLNDWKKPSK
ncbi:MAG: hypothetical protein DYH02_13500 [Candidatus Omnitrophica bacterium COP1]|nr:hypothetical protein [Candidatus Omnitrophica bacterium COP1]